MYPLGRIPAGPSDSGPYSDYPICQQQKNNSQPSSNKVAVNLFVVPYFLRGGIAGRLLAGQLSVLLFVDPWRGKPAGPFIQSACQRASRSELAVSQLHGGMGPLSLAGWFPAC